MKYIRGCKITQLDIADDFYEAYLRCNRTNSDGKFVAIPAFANGLFACELYLKCLINGTKKGHDLKELFDALDEEKRKELLNVKCEDEYTLEGLLNDIGNGFEVWRYCFEDEHKPFDEERPFEYSEYFLKVYLPILKNMAHRHNACNQQN